MNKKGFTTFSLFAVLITAVIMLVVLGVFTYGITIYDDSLQKLNGTEIGNQVWDDVYNDVAGPGIGFLKNDFARNIGLGILLGMVVLLAITGFTFRSNKPAFMVLDIFIIIGATVLAVVLKGSFQKMINIDPTFLQIFSTQLSSSSKFILALPTTTVILGVIVMIATYAFSSKTQAIETQEDLGL